MTTFVTHPSRQVVRTGEKIARYLDRDILEWIETADGCRYVYVGICGPQPDLDTLKPGQCVIAPGLIYQKMYPPIDATQAYVAIRPDGFVDGACFTASPDSSAWCAEMEDAGMRIEVHERAEAKRILFTTLPK